MTRINCIPPRELCREHLVAEYRELPRVVRLANRAWQRGLDRPPPQRYTLGPGHVQFFYTRMGWVQRRFRALVKEMQRRGYELQFPELPDVLVGEAWQRGWRPDKLALDINRQRIAARLAQMRSRQ